MQVPHQCLLGVLWVYDASSTSVFAWCTVGLWCKFHISVCLVYCGFILQVPHQCLLGVLWVYGASSTSVFAWCTVGL